MKYKIAPLLLFLVLLWPLTTRAQLADITIQEDTSLNFGIILADNSASSVTVRPNGTHNATGNTIVTGPISNAFFRLTGEPNTNFTVGFSTGDFLTGPGEAMELSRFRHNNRNNLFFRNNGRRNLKVGARLLLNNNQVAGNYTGTYTLIIEYP